MADITNAAIGVNKHNFEVGAKKHSSDTQCQCKDTNKGGEPDKILNSLDAMSAYNQGKINARNKAQDVKSAQGAYEFNPNNVADDVEAFQENFAIVKDIASDYMKSLMENGYEASAAEDKAAQFAACLLTNQNV